MKFRFERHHGFWYNGYFGKDGFTLSNCVFWDALRHGLRKLLTRKE